MDGSRMRAIIVFFCPPRDQVIGRKILPVRICTCPKRDMETEEKQEKKNISTVQAPPRPEENGKVKMEPKDTADNLQEFWVLVSSCRNIHEGATQSARSPFFY